MTAIAILNLMKSLIGKSTLRVELLSDNTGCIANILHTVTTWRNRHFCIRAAALRDQLTEHSIDLKYRSGRLILAKNNQGRSQFQLAPELIDARLRVFPLSQQQLTSVLIVFI